MTPPIAAVTGAARGIGLATARSLAEEGYVVHLVDRDGKALATAVRELTGRGHNALGHVVDLFDESGPRQMVAAIRAETPRLDAVVNNAFQNSRSLLVSSTANELRDELNRLVVSYHQVVRESLELLRASSRPSIVNLASVRGRYGGAGFGPYSVGKAAVAQLSRVLALELAAEGIRVNAVAPGVIDTARVQALSSQRREAIAALTPLGRLGHPDDVALVIRFLVSQEAGFVTGQVLTVDGGLTLPLTIDGIDAILDLERRQDPDSS